MRKSSQLILGMALIFGISTGAQAQHGARSSGLMPVAPMRRPVVAVRPAQASRGTMGTPRSGTTTSTSASTSTTATPGTSSNVILFSGSSPLSVADLLNPLPAPWFDFSHLAAINRDLDIRALIDPVTQLRLAQAERLLRETPVVSGGFPFFSAPTPIILEQPEAQPQPQPQVIIIQQPAPAETASQRSSERAPSTEAAPEQPVPDAGEFVLVRRDGGIIFASAFTRKDDRIIYVTREGLRRTVPLDQIDTDATVHMNEDRGTSLQQSL